MSWWGHAGLRIATCCIYTSLMHKRGMQCLIWKPQRNQVPWPIWGNFCNENAPLMTFLEGICSMKQSWIFLSFFLPFSFLSFATELQFFFISCFSLLALTAFWPACLPFCLSTYSVSCLPKGIQGQLVCYNEESGTFQNSLSYLLSNLCFFHVGLIILTKKVTITFLYPLMPFIKGKLLEFRKNVTNIVPTLSCFLAPIPPGTLYLSLINKPVLIKR